MREIIFTYNWNNKLDCKSFTCLRLSDRYKVGQEYKILLKTKEGLIAKGVAKIIDVKHLTLDKINTFVSHIDTGYGEIQCRQIIVSMYPNANWQIEKLKLILFKYI